MMTEDVGVKPPAEAIHLGDGAYAAFDGYHIWLGANHHLNRQVAILPDALVNLIRYARSVGWQI